MQFKQAVTNTPSQSVTANGMATLATSANPVVDLFFLIGASRGKDITAPFTAAYNHDRVLALKCLLWGRDVRGGAGERKMFRDLMLHLEDRSPQEAAALIPYVPFFGRWDDLLVFQTETMRHRAFSVIAEGLKDPKTSGLAAKWMPRKGQIANDLRKFLALTPKAYRKLLVGLTNVVETKMCAKAWDEIDFSKLPSLASARYQKAFNKRAAEKYAAYKASLVKGESKVNAGAVYPYDVIKSITRGDADVAKAQWEALPNYLGDDFILPMVDVSGSMDTKIGGSKSMTCMDMSVALGLYLADKQQGAFRDMFLTFHENPQINILSGDILSKHSAMRRAEWGGNTDINKAFGEILRIAKANNVPQTQMPKYLLILSDMEFDQASRRSATAFDTARDLFAAAGYALPKIIFWNLNARRGNIPVQYRQDGTALVSGFSPSIMTAILGAKEFTPEAVMLAALNNPRYAVVQ